MRRVFTAVTEPHAVTDGALGEAEAPETMELPRGPIFDDPDFEPALQNLGRELTHVTGVLGEVARTLGACPRCFGIDRECLRCEGQGSPGWHESGEPALLEYWLRSIAGGRRSRSRGS